MNNKNNTSNWINMESSGGLHYDFFDSNKSCFKFKEESHSGGAFKYFNLAD